MRTTLALDEDVRAELERVRKERQMKLRDLVNEALRAGLVVLREGPRARPGAYRTEPVSLGSRRFTDLDDVAEILEAAEADDGRPCRNR